jgi:hypothetical protein
LPVNPNETIQRQGADCVSDKGHSGIDRVHLEDLIAAESKRRDALLESQIKMNNFQMDYIKARTDALNRGDGMITINATGLEPELELMTIMILTRG